MKGRRSIVVIEDFYADPDSVRQWALEQPYYHPYEGDESWNTTLYRKYEDCPFQSNTSLVKKLQEAVDEEIDMGTWKTPYPIPEGIEAKPGYKKTVAANASCLWNCAIHVKTTSSQVLGHGIHNHVIDYWNAVGYDGWAGLLYLNLEAPIDGGLYLWKNQDPANNWNWMTPPDHWVNLDKFANLYNRLILVRGNIPHSGAVGWSDNIKAGRMFQTFFFRTMAKPYDYSVSISRSALGL